MTQQTQWTFARANLLWICYGEIVKLLQTCYGKLPTYYGLATGKLV